MMKTLIACISTLLLMTFSLMSFADKTLLFTKPALLKANGSYYSFPEIYTHDMNHYHYVSIARENRICYLHPQNNLVGLDMLRINLEILGKRYPWYCYKFDPRFFEIDY